MGECAWQVPNIAAAIYFRSPAVVYSILKTCEDISRKPPASVKMLYVHRELLTGKGLQNKLRVSEWRPMPQSRSLSVLSILVSDLRASARLAADARSRFRLSMDYVLSRLIGLVPRVRRDRVREVRLRGDIKIRYRLNKGDLHSIREIWFQEVYRLPFQGSSGVLLDLGANIGMASLWLAKNYSFTRVIAVEPDPNNAALARQNLELNGVASETLEAAIGPKEAMVRFEFNELSNLGRLSENGSLVKMISVGHNYPEIWSDRPLL